MKKKNNNNIVPPPLPHKCIIVLIDYWMWDRDDGDSVDAGIGDRKDVGRFGSRYFVCSAIRPSSVLSKISVVGTTAAAPPPTTTCNTTKCNTTKCTTTTCTTTCTNHPSASPMDKWKWKD